MDLKQLVEELSEGLGRPSAHVAIDEKQRVSGIRSSPDHLIVPLTDAGPSGAVLRLSTGGCAPLTSSDYSLIEAATSIARDLIATDGTTLRDLHETTDDITPAAGRSTVMSRLLHVDGRIRRAAFRDAVSHRWLDRGSSTIVRAVLVDDGVSTLQKVHLGRHLAAATPTHTTFIREHESVVYLVTRDSRTDIDLDTWIRSESIALRVPVVSIGSARHDPTSIDLAEAAERARVAMDLTAALPELAPTNSIDELGGWVLLHGVDAGSRRLSDISPAADQLCRAGDELQRQTVEVYLDAGGQARVACERLHIHRTTLYYRLDNMPDVVRDALDDGMKRSTLHLALKLIRLWEANGAA